MREPQLFGKKFPSRSLARRRREMGRGAIESAQMALPGEKNRFPAESTSRPPREFAGAALRGPRRVFADTRERIRRRRETRARDRSCCRRRSAPAPPAGPATHRGPGSASNTAITRSARVELVSRTLHAEAFDLVARFAQPGSVDHDQRHALDQDRLAQRVARGAGNRRDDRSFLARQAVEQARLADVRVGRRARRGCRRAAGSPAGSWRAPRQATARACARRAAASSRCRASTSSSGKVEHRFGERAQLDQPAPGARRSLRKIRRSASAAPSAPPRGSPHR